MRRALNRGTPFSLCGVTFKIWLSLPTILRFFSDMAGQKTTHNFFCTFWIVPMRSVPTTLKHLEVSIITDSVSNFLRANRWRDRIDGSSNNQRRTYDRFNFITHVHMSHFIGKEMQSYFRTLDGLFTKSICCCLVRVAVKR